MSSPTLRAVGEHTEARSWSRKDIVDDDVMQRLLCTDRTIRTSITGVFSGTHVIPVGGAVGGAWGARNICLGTKKPEVEYELMSVVGTLTAGTTLRGIRGETEQVRVVRDDAVLHMMVKDGVWPQLHSMYDTLNGAHYLNAYRVKQHVQNYRDEEINPGGAQQVTGGCAVSCKDINPGRQLYGIIGEMSTKAVGDQKSEVLHTGGVMSLLHGVIVAALHSLGVLSARASSEPARLERVVEATRNTLLWQLLHEYTALHNRLCQHVIETCQHCHIQGVQSAIPSLPAAGDACKYMAYLCIACRSAQETDVKMMLHAICHHADPDNKICQVQLIMHEYLMLLDIRADLLMQIHNVFATNVDTNCAPGSVAFHFVAAIQCTFWPEACEEWFGRSRSWPPQEVVDKIRREGCELVPDARKVPRHCDDGMNTDCDWRISTARAEGTLSLARTPRQKIAFYTFQLLFYKLVKPVEVGGRSLPSYCVNTIMLHMSEQREASWWDQATSLTVLEMFRRMLVCVQVARLGHYFMPRVNLFDNWGLPPDLTRALVTRLTGIVATPHRLVLLCQGELDFLIPRDLPRL